jgi:hypothetical protein
MRLIYVFTFIAIMLFSTAALGQSDSTGQQSNVLFKPDFIRLEVSRKTFKDVAGPLTEPYKGGDKIFFELFLTNTSPQQVLIPIVDHYFQNRPQLLRDGHPVPYRDAVAKLVKSKDKQPVFSRTDVLRLERYETKRVKLVNISDWYELLEPGHYELVVKHRFILGGAWIESSPVTFEVVP